MQDGTVSRDGPPQQIPVSPDNPCPFLRALVAEGFVDGGKMRPPAQLNSGVPGTKASNAAQNCAR
jgi:hypothetical protein